MGMETIEREGMTDDEFLAWEAKKIAMVGQDYWDELIDAYDAGLLD